MPTICRCNSVRDTQGVASRYGRPVDAYTESEDEHVGKYVSPVPDAEVC